VYKKICRHFHPDKAKKLGLTLEKAVEHEEIYKLLGNMNAEW
jgi:preprotein translocase subunit Sec63